MSGKAVSEMERINVVNDYDLVYISQRTSDGPGSTTKDYISKKIEWRDIVHAIVSSIFGQILTDKDAYDQRKTDTLALPSANALRQILSGYTGTKTQATNLKWNSNGQIELWGCEFRYENGLLKSISDEKIIATLDTVGYSRS